MEFLSEKLVRSEELENRIKMICSFNNAKCQFIEGRILKVDKVNVSFIEAHKIDIKIKGKKILLLYFDKNNLFLYDRSTQITVDKLDMLLKSLKGC